MRTVDNPPSVIIQLLLSPFRPPKFRPLAFPLFPLALVASEVVIPKPQLGQLGFTEGDWEAEGRQIHFPTSSIHPMLCEVPKQFSTNLRMLGNRPTLKATRKSSRNILSKLACASCIRGATTIPFGPGMGPGSDSEGEPDEVPLRRPRNSLTAPSTSPVVYKSRPTPRN